MDLSGKVFELIENNSGLAGGSTRMVFSDCSTPYEATYSGPNVSNGHVLVMESNNRLNMVYQALANEGELVAGKAEVVLNLKIEEKLNMQLNWQWLTGDLSSGISRWVEISE